MASPSRRQHKKYWVHRFLNRFAGVRSRKFHRFLKVLTGIGYALAGVSLVLVQFCDPDDQWFSPAWREYLTYVHANQFAVVAYLLGTQLLLQAANWIADRFQAPDVVKLDRVLDHLVSRHFGDKDLETHKYRATLFKVRSFWPFGTWLGIVGRSGMLYPQRTTVFSIDATTEKYNTGIAGECWRQSGQTIFKKLPDIREDSTSEEAINEFKLAGYLDDCEYQAMSVKSTVFLATGIRVAGKIWGILVLDTTDPKQHPTDRQQKHHRETLDFAAIALSNLLS